MFVDDLVDSIWFCTENLYKMPKIINLGIDTDYSVTEYYQIISEIMGFGSFFAYDKNKPAGMKRKLMGSQRIKELGWQNQYDLNQGLTKTIQHFVRPRTGESDDC